MWLDFVEKVAEEGVAGRDRFSQAPRRWIEFVGVGEGGVIGFESKGPLNVRVIGTRRSFVWRCPGGVGRALLSKGCEKAEPMSDSVSERTERMREGAMAGTWEEGERGGRLMKEGWRFAVR